jgi:hypothetical protein
MADPRTETELDADPGVPDPTPEEAARLLAAVRRAQEDAAAGRVYRTSEEGLRAVLRHAERLRTPGTQEDGARRPVPDVEEAVREAVEQGLKRGWLERA